MYCGTACRAIRIPEPGAIHDHGATVHCTVARTGTFCALRSRPHSEVETRNERRCAPSLEIFCTNVCLEILQNWLYPPFFAAGGFHQPHPARVPRLSSQQTDHQHAVRYTKSLGGGALHASIGSCAGLSCVCEFTRLDRLGSVARAFQEQNYKPSYEHSRWEVHA